MGFLFGRFRLLRVLASSGRLAWRLLRDSRTPVLPKLILGAAVLYAISPIDLVPDFIPGLGQLDDIAVVTLGLELFLKNVPPWLKAEHEAAMGRTHRGDTIIDAKPRGPADRGRWDT